MNALTHYAIAATNSKNTDH